MSVQVKSAKIMWRQLITLHKDDSRTLQLQIRTRIVDAILNGTLRAGSILPSSRRLADELEVSRNTVILAYQQLVDDGFLVARERTRFVVAARPLAGWANSGSAAMTGADADAAKADWSSRLRSQAASFRNIEKPSNWQAFPYPFLYGQFDAGVFPISDWRQCCRQAMSLLELRDWGPDKVDEDDPMLIEQLRSRVLPRRGIWANSDEIMVTVGAQQGLYLLAEALFGPGTIVGLEEPGYPDMRNIVAMRTDRVVSLAVDESGVSPSADLDACDYVHVTPSHQCPTTVTMPLDRRHALLEAAARSGTVLIEDDYDSEISFNGDPQPALKSLDRSGEVIYVASLSKLLAPGLRLGYIVAHPDLIRELRALRRLMVRHPPLNNQRAVALFLSGGHYEPLVRRLTSIYRDRATRISEALGDLAPKLRYTTPSGGSCLWLRGPDTFDARRSAPWARERGLLYEPGDVFFRNSQDGAPTVRLGFSAIAEDRIGRGVAMLNETIDRGVQAPFG